MTNSIALIIFFVLMVIVIVGIDVLFFYGQVYFWERLISNVGIVLLFIAFYLRFLK